MRGTRAKMIRKHLRPLFSKEEMPLPHRSISCGVHLQILINYFRYSSDSFQRRYKNAKMAVV